MASIQCHFSLEVYVGDVLCQARHNTPPSKGGIALAISLLDFEPLVLREASEQAGRSGRSHVHTFNRGKSCSFQFVPKELARLLEQGALTFMLLSRLSPKQARLDASGGLRTTSLRPPPPPSPAAAATVAARVAAAGNAAADVVQWEPEMHFVRHWGLLRQTVTLRSVDGEPVATAAVAVSLACLGRGLAAMPRTLPLQLQRRGVAKEEGEDPSAAVVPGDTLHSDAAEAAWLVAGEVAASASAVAAAVVMTSPPTGAAKMAAAAAARRHPAGASDIKNAGSGVLVAELLPGRPLRFLRGQPAVTPAAPPAAPRAATAEGIASALAPLPQLPALAAAADAATQAMTGESPAATPSALATASAAERGSGSVVEGGTPGALTAAMAAGSEREDGGIAPENEENLAVMDRVVLALSSGASPLVVLPEYVFCGPLPGNNHLRMGRTAVAAIAAAGGDNCGGGSGGKAAPLFISAVRRDGEGGSPLRRVPPPATGASSAARRTSPVKKGRGPGKGRLPLRDAQNQWETPGKAITLMAAPAAPAAETAAATSGATASRGVDPGTHVLGRLLDEVVGGNGSNDGSGGDNSGGGVCSGGPSVLSRLFVEMSILQASVLASSPAKTPSWRWRRAEQWQTHSGTGAPPAVTSSTPPLAGMGAPVPRSLTPPARRPLAADSPPPSPPPPPPPLSMEDELTVLRWFRSRMDSNGTVRVPPAVATADAAASGSVATTEDMQPKKFTADSAGRLVLPPVAAAAFAVLRTFGNARATWSELTDACAAVAAADGALRADAAWTSATAPVPSTALAVGAAPVIAASAPLLTTAEAPAGAAAAAATPTTAAVTRRSASAVAATSARWGGALVTKILTGR
ncbi:unnamed protein product, partial [Phaeothamnion confervicola]